jgi:hypothetical protein
MDSQISRKMYFSRRIKPFYHERTNLSSNLMVFLPKTMERSLVNIARAMSVAMSTEAGKE